MDVAEFPLHARGWTLYRRLKSSTGDVSPARAGMDPDPEESHKVQNRFPRTRGDGPGHTQTSDIENRFPPHARGWTFLKEHVLLPPSVSPARAGMDRIPCYSSALFACFPRTRGDGPTIDTREAVAA